MTQNRRKKVTPQSPNNDNLPLFDDVKNGKSKIKTPETKQHLSNDATAEKQALVKKSLANILNKNNKLEEKEVEKTFTRKKGATIQTVTRDETSGYTLGVFLQEARVKAGYSLSQVAMMTKLSIHYIEAIERDDFKNTPPHIYVKAYVKKLSSLYEVDEQKAVGLLTPFGDYESNISNTIMHDLQETKQVNQQDEKRIQLFMKIIYIVIGLVAAVVIILGLYFWISSDDSKTPNKPLTPAQNAAITKKMEKLIIPESISLTELKVKKK